MAGKSTYLRQVALIALLAHVGSFVPAEFARIGIVDRIFTRVGAEDDLSAGLSTFMLEMLETAFILRHATERSLVALDEVGRGTSTRDGLAIARAVIEYLHDEVRARTLFATHFHELAALAETLPRLRLYRMDIAERDGRTVFLHRVVAGASDESYGVHVARIAGIPAEVTRRADDLLARRADAVARVAEAGVPYDAANRDVEAFDRASSGGDAQSLLRLSPGAEQVLLALASVNIAATTPLERAERVIFTCNSELLCYCNSGVAKDGDASGCAQRRAAHRTLAARGDRAHRGGRDHRASGLGGPRADRERSGRGRDQRARRAARGRTAAAARCG